MDKKRVRIVTVVLGIMACILGYYLSTLFTGTYCVDAEYGGDAYTGIQNAAADTANNVMHATRAITLGFSCLMYFFGAVMFGTAICITNKSKSDGNNTASNPDYSTYENSYTSPVKPERISKNLILCPKCKMQQIDSNDRCINCGVTFDKSENLN